MVDHLRGHVMRRARALHDILADVQRDDPLPVRHGREQPRQRAKGALPRHFDLLGGLLYLRDVRGEAEVDELQRRSRGTVHEENVLGLDVPVDDM